MRVFVISLQQAARRRASIKTQLEFFGVPYAFFDSVTPEDSPAGLFRRCDSRAFWLNTGRQPLDAEIACYASHLLLWRKCVALGEPVVVLEDDAELQPGFADTLRCVLKDIHELGFVRLQDSCKPTGQVMSRFDSRVVAFCKKYPYGATAYVVSPSVAKVFLVHSRIFGAPVDKFIKDFWVHGQPLFAVQPGVVSVGKLAETSDIGRRHKEPQSLRQACSRLRYKSSGILQRAFFNATYRLGDVRAMLGAQQTIAAIPLRLKLPAGADSWQDR